LVGETEVLGENLSQCRFVHHEPHMLPGRELGPPRWEASDGTAFLVRNVVYSVEFELTFGGIFCLDFQG
jgi:hypothetical protein